MRRHIHLVGTIIVIGALPCLAGCVTVQLTPEAERVRVTSNPDAVKGCTLIGNVDASDQWNGGQFGQMAAEENANRTLKNKTAAMNANTVFVTTSTTNTGGSRIRGEAYNCQPARQPTPGLLGPTER